MAVSSRHVALQEKNIVEERCQNEGTIALHEFYKDSEEHKRVKGGWSFKARRIANRENRIEPLLWNSEKSRPEIRKPLRTKNKSTAAHPN